ncbi:MAG: chromosome segregation protein SMC [Bdellovibrionales bacterium]|nr:chromosome segregation protein SMC [Bdellovibrionales bacterium]
MRIKKLELVGFKSFKDKTVIHFDAGITGIVGPNGCGKSNIVDALVWVMGEMSAKHLRGSSMEDVIFAGAEGYAPMGLCEVSLTLENDGGPFPVKYLNHSEIMITRRLHRSGESEYLINKEVARLRDIQEVFMDTGAGSKGFSIIEQGAIGRIVTAKPEERRTLIEEAAGITKFKARKRESQRKLEATENNLVRLQDIIGELKRQLESLQRQAQRAERYRRLKQDIEALEMWLAAIEFNSLKEKTEAAEALYNSARDRDLASSTHSTTLEAEVQTFKADVAEFERQIQIKQQTLKEHSDSLRDKEKTIQELQFEIEQARRSKEMTGSLASESTTRRDLLNRDIQEVAARLTRLVDEVESLTEDYQNKKTEFDGHQANIKVYDDELTNIRRELLTVMQAETSMSARSLSMEENLQGLREQELEVKNILEQLENQSSAIQKNYKTVSEAFEKERQLQLSVVADVEALSANRVHLAADLENKTNELNEYKDRLNEVTSRLYGLEDLQNNFEGFQDGVKSVMLWQRQRLEPMTDAEREAQQSYVPISEIVEVPKEYELAMEAALGPRLQMILSSNTNSAVDAVSYLKDNKNGRSSFYSADALQAVASEKLEPLRADDRVKALLKDIVSVPAKHQEVIGRILDRVAVVESLVDAVELIKQNPGWTFVSTDGDVATADGMISGGAPEDASSGVLKRQREIKELKLSKDEWASKLALAQMTHKKTESTLKKMTEDLEQAQKDQTEKEIAVAKLKSELDRAEVEVKNAATAIDRQQSEVEKVVQKLSEKSEEYVTLQNHLEELREKKMSLEERSQKLTVDLEAAKAGVGSLQDTVTHLQIDVAKKTQEKEGFQREYDMLKASLDEVESRISRMSEETQRSIEFVSQNQILLEEKRLELEVSIRRVKDDEEVVARLRDEYEQKHTELVERQEQLSEQMAVKNQLQATMNEAQLQLQQAKMKESNLTEQIRERYQKELSEVYTQHLNREGDPSTAAEELKDYKEKIARIGEVNLSAIEEYDEISGRYEFLSKQYTDLVDAKDQLRKVIDRINRICSKRFKETFEAVNDRFQKVFPVLFGGGEARLILIEDPEKGEMGIDIVSRPPGKKAQSVTLLSGGEKALTAVSLIFSIFLVKPSPYCLLDEVDAPLDDANVMRFNELVKEMAKRSQIIVVTHNKYTMEVAEKLYGVTQEEKGVSKMVSVDLASHLNEAAQAELV